MREFSDIPEFILDEYLNMLVNGATETVTINQIIWDEVLFSNLNVDFINFNDVRWNNNNESYDKYNIYNSYLITPNSTIFTQGGQNIQTFVETNEEFKKIKISPLKDDLKVTDRDWVGTYYNFSILDYIYPEPTDEVKYTLSGDNYEFIQYDAFKDKRQSIDTRSGFNVYLRKGSLFHNWGKGTYYDYMNFDKDFLYVGRLFPYTGDIWKCRIYRYLLKDYVINLLPTNNRTEKLVEFLYHIFDKVYSKIYYKNNNIKTLYDANEIEVENIDELVSNFGVNIDIQNYEEENTNKLRDFVSNIPILLKKKGTYSSLFSVWFMMSQMYDEPQPTTTETPSADIPNIIYYDSQYSRSMNIYEYWHNTLPEDRTVVNDDEWQEINYLNRFDDEIDFTGCSGKSYYNKYIRTYPDFYKTNVYETVKDSYIHKQEEPNSVWEINHFINETELVVQCYNEEFEEIIPQSIIIQDNATVVVNFNKDTVGYCAVQKAQYGELSLGSYWKTKHYINSKLILTQTFDTFEERFMPKFIYSQDYDTGIVQTTESGYGYYLEGDYIYYDLNAEEQNRRIWTVNHGLFSLLFVQVFDMNDNLLYPKRISHNDLLSTTIEFSKPINGYVIMKEIGDVFNKPIDGKILSPHFKVECDLTCKPIDSQNIIEENTVDNLISNFEEMRDITRVPHYHFVFAPICDFSGGIIGTYNQRYTPYWLSSCIFGRFSEYVSYHHQIEESDTWEIQHNQKTDNFLVFIYDTDYNQIYFKNFDYIDYSNISVYFEIPQSGYAIIVRSDENGFILEQGTEITHDFGRNLISQFFTLTEGEMVFPKSIINSENILYLGESEEGRYQLTEGNLVYTQTEPSSAWNINHDFNTTGIIAQFYDEDWERIMPSSFTLDSKDTCISTFSEPASGYAVVKSVGFIDFKQDITNELLKDGANVVIGSGDNKFHILDDSMDSVQEEIATLELDPNNIIQYQDDLYIDIELTEEMEFDIQEIAIYNKLNTRLFFYSQGSVIHKKKGTTMTIYFRVSSQDI